jgi:hypothetical protein
VRFSYATAKLNDIDPQVWLGDVLGRLRIHVGDRERGPMLSRQP